VDRQSVLYNLMTPFLLCIDAMLGDIRSRLVRLIPLAPPDSPLDSIRRLLAYRLPTQCSEVIAREEWRDIVEGRSSLWKGIPSDRKETIRGMDISCQMYPGCSYNFPSGFLVHFESELLKRAHKNFDFRNGRYDLPSLTCVGF